MGGGTTGSGGGGGGSRNRGVYGGEVSVGGCRNRCRNLRVMEGRCRLFGRSRNPCVRDVICKIISTLKSHSRRGKKRREKKVTVEPCLYGQCLFRSRDFALRCYAFGGCAPRERIERGSRLCGGWGVGGGGGAGRLGGGVDAEPCVGNFTVDADCPGCR